MRRRPRRDRGGRALNGFEAGDHGKGRISAEVWASTLEAFISAHDQVAAGPGALALEVAKAEVPDYSSKFSPRLYTQPQLLALLALREFLKVDYRGLVALLADWSDLRDELGLSSVPDFSTLQRAARRLLEKEGPTPSCGGPSRSRGHAA